MRKLNKVLGYALVTAFTFLLFLANTVTAKADYTYRIKFSTGNNVNAYFDETVVDSLKATYGDANVELKITEKTQQVTIKGLEYNTKVTVDVDELIKINGDATTGEEKYYVKGIRITGQDDLVAADANKTVTLDVVGDETYIAAYGVGQVVSYTAKYQDEDGNSLFDDETMYAVKGEIVYVPARHISGYKPDAYYKTDSRGVSDGEEFIFVYTKNESNIVYNYDYEYETLTSYSTSGSTVDNGTTTVVNNGGTSTNGGNAVAGDNGGAGGAGGANAEAGEAEAGEAGAGAEQGQTIADEETPQDIIDIADDETAKAGGEKDAKDNFVRNMIIAIVFAIVAVIIILVTLYVASSKRKTEIAKNSKKDE